MTAGSEFRSICDAYCEMAIYANYRPAARAPALPAASGELEREATQYAKQLIDDMQGGTWGIDSRTVRAAVYAREVWQLLRRDHEAIVVHALMLMMLSEHAPLAVGIGSPVGGVQ
jgi:hypothetical protein